MKYIRYILLVVLIFLIGCATPIHFVPITEKDLPEPYYLRVRILVEFINSKDAGRPVYCVDDKEIYRDIALTEHILQKIPLYLVVTEIYGFERNTALTYWDLINFANC